MLSGQTDSVHRMEPVIGERIKRARIAAGLSQSEVAKQVEFSAARVSKLERGLVAPTSQTLIQLARALGTRTEFFLRPTTIELQTLGCRKRASLPKKQMARVEVDVCDQVERFLELLSLFPKRPIARFEVPAAVPASIESYDQIEEAALAVREAWYLGHDAILDLPDTLERRGLAVFTTNADQSAKFDGLAKMGGGLPVVAVGSVFPGDRRHFTMAHELGHLVLSNRLDERLDEEKACDRFAGAFLVPEQVVCRELGAHRAWLEPLELYSLKHEYRLSMMAWIYRASAAKVITDHTKTKLLRLFSLRGWRKKEPGKPVASETPKLFERLVLHALAEEMISTSKAAELMSMRIAAFQDRLRFREPHGAAHQ